ncbi:MAG: divalent-cation tolerance protein CutA [Nitrospirota bacterium]|jgi:periplasmic divalent cation tolerance protein
MAEARLIITTVDSAASARALATSLVDDRLAACVSIIPGVESLYRWQGAVESAAEWLLLIKTTADRGVDCLDALMGRHPYEVPEGLVFDATGGLPDYLAWLGASVVSSVD